MNKLYYIGDPSPIADEEILRGQAVTVASTGAATLSDGTSYTGIAAQDYEEGDVVSLVQIGSEEVRLGGEVEVGDYLTPDENGDLVKIDLEAEDGIQIIVGAANAARGAGQLCLATLSPFAVELSD